MEGSQYFPRTCNYFDKSRTPSFQNPPDSRMPPTPRQPPSPILKSRTLNNLFPLKPSTSGEEPFAMTQVTDTASETHPAITISTALDFEECLDLLDFDKEKDRHKADHKGLKRDLEISDRLKQSFA